MNMFILHFVYVRGQIHTPEPIPGRHVAMCRRAPRKSYSQPPHTSG